MKRTLLTLVIIATASPAAAQYYQIPQPVPFTPIPYTPVPPPPPIPQYVPYTPQPLYQPPQPQRTVICNTIGRTTYCN
jgi:hypothetical protein